MSDNLNTQVVLAFFDNADLAEGAAHDLMNWDKANDAIKLGAIAILTNTPDGRLVANRFKANKAGSGATVGLLIGAVTGLLTGGLSLLGGAVGGSLLGGVVGALSQESIGISEDDLSAISAQLRKGKAALSVLCDDFEVDATVTQLKQAGGDARHFGVSTKVLEALADAQRDATAQAMRDQVAIDRGHLPTV
jgi:uncharacterized membrane protein